MIEHQEPAKRRENTYHPAAAIEFVGGLKDHVVCVVGDTWIRLTLRDGVRGWEPVAV